MNKGWISLHRQFQDHWLWGEPRKYSKAEAWLDILMSAAHKEYKAVINENIITCERGEWIASIRFLQKRWQWSNSKIVKFLLVLEKDDMLTLEKKTGVTVIKVSNYNEHQDREEIKKTQKRQKRDGKATPERQQSDKDNKVNKVNKVNKGITNTPSEKEFVEYLVENLPKRNPDWTPARATRAAKARYETYTASGWMTGGNKPKPITIWKTSALNAINYEKPWSYGSDEKPQQQTFAERNQEFKDASFKKGIKTIC
jgi:hypothetical protein